MHRTISALLMSLALGGAYAQGTDGGVTMSTDPAKAAAIESHAQELKAHQGREATAPAHKSTAKASTKKSHATTTKGKTASTHKSSTTKHAKSSKG